MSDRSVPLTKPDDGYEICYECNGKRLCWSCRGEGRMSDGLTCYSCAGRGLCIVCNGDAQLPAGTEAQVRGPTRTVTRVAHLIGRFRELGYEGGPSIEQARGSKERANRDKVVAYLRAGKTLVMTPQLLRDVYDRSLAAGSRSIVTDGVFAWPDGLAHYVERYDVAVPAEFEEHMMRNGWRVPPEIDLKGLGTD